MKSALANHEALLSSNFQVKTPLSRGWMNVSWITGCLATYSTASSGPFVGRRGNAAGMHQFHGPIAERFRRQENRDRHVAELRHKESILHISADSSLIDRMASVSFKASVSNQPLTSAGALTGMMGSRHCRSS